MAEQLEGPFGEFVDWRHCPALMLLCLPRHNSITAAHYRHSTNFSNGLRIHISL